MLRFFPFGDSFEAGMGARALAPDEPLCDLELAHYAAETALKHRLLTDTPHEYFSGGAGTLEAQWEVLELVLTDLAKHHPDVFGLERDGTLWSWHNALLGEHQRFSFGDAASLPLEPLDWVGRQVQEGLVLVSADERGAFVGGQLCFPNGWAISDRLGKSFGEVHERTPQPTMPSVHAGARLLRGMKAGKTLWRMSWNFKLTDQLDLSTKHKGRYKADFAARAPQLTAEAAGREIVIRVERQTFTRLYGSPYALFGIHTYNSRLEDEAADPERARRILGVVRAAPEEVKRYKAITPIEAAMTAYLEKAQQR